MFTFDIDAQEVTWSAEIIPDVGTQLSQWGQDTMWFGPDGLIYGSSVNRIFSLDPATKTATILDDSGSFAAPDAAGNIYYAKTAQLYRIDLES